MSKSNLIKQGSYLVVLSIGLAGLSFIKEAVFANYFGISEIADAYTVAIQIPEILFAVVWEAIHTIVVPIYTERRQESDSSATKFISVFFSAVLFGTILFVFIGEWASDALVFIFAPGVSEGTRQLANSLLKWIFPVLVFEGIERICIAVLNVHGKFTFAKIIGGIRNFAIIFYIVIFTSRFGIYAAAYGMLTGIVLEGCISLFFTRKYEKIHLVMDLRDKSVKKACSLLGPVVIGSGLSEINKIVDKIVSSFLETGSIASLNYSMKLTNIIETIFLNNIITLVYPLYSKLAVEGRKEELKQVYLRTISIGMIICMPIIFGGMFLKKELVSLAFERGKFDEIAVEIVGGLFACYLLNALFAVIRGASVRIYTACYKTRIVSINSMICVGINIFLNVILSKRLGVVGLALATDISTMIACVHLLYNVKTILPGIQFKEVFGVGIKAIISSGVMYIVLKMLEKVLKGDIYTVKLELLYVILSVAVGGLIYIFTLLLLRVPLVTDIIKNGMKKVFREE